MQIQQTLDLAQPTKPSSHTHAEDGCTLAAYHLADLTANLDLAIKDMMSNKSVPERTKLYAAKHLILIHERLKVETNKMLAMARYRQGETRLPDHFIISEAV